MDRDSDGADEKKTTNVTLVLHPIPGSEDQFLEKLRETSEVNPSGPSPSSGFAVSLDCEDVVDIVVGPSHLGFLLRNGKVCRLKYSFDAESLDLGKSEVAKSTPVTKPPTTGNSGKPTNSVPLVSSATRSTSARNRAAARLSTGRISSSSTLTGLSSSSVTGRLTRAGLSRGPVVPALYVPEELVSQAQMVLQGKSRAVIVRELQRTNLDVNLAVNNLLSRDDEENEGGDDVDSYVSDDLISLLDAGLSASEHPSVIIDAERLFSEDVLGYAPRRTFGRSAARDRDYRSSAADRDAGCPEEGSSASDRESRDSLFRGWREVRDRAYGNQGSAASGRDLTKARWLESAIRDTFDKDSDRTKKDTTPAESNTVVSVEELEYWPEDDVDKGEKFVKIASMHSELVAITEKGKLCQWRWLSAKPYRCPRDRRVRHPRARGLNLINEKIIMVSGSMIRCSVVTETSKVATWVDESIGAYCGRLEHSAVSFPEFGKETVTELFTCPLYTCVRLVSGSLFWWGVWPYEQRKKQLEESRVRLRKNHTETSSAVIEGSIVTLKSCPVYQAKAVGFNLSNGEPRVGRLMTSAWSFAESRTFTLIGGSENRVPEGSESPVHGVTLKSRKRKLESTEENETPVAEARQEVMWNVKDVVFVEDIRTVATAEVLRVDGLFAICRFHGKNEEISLDSPKVCKKKSKVEKRKDQGADGETSTEKESSETALSEKLQHWKESRVIRSDDLMVVKPGSLKQLESFQKLPRKIPISDPSKIVSMKVDKTGIHAVVKNSNGRLSYTIFNLATGKIVRQSSFPRESSSFLSEKGGIQLRSCGDITGDEIDSVSILLDGNRTIYPLAKDSVQGIKDPWWLDVRPLSCVGLGISPLPSIQGTVGITMERGAIAVVAMAFQEQFLMPYVLRSDVEGVNNALAALEKKSDTDNFEASIKKVMEEKCDGNRNLLHACVLTNRPTANHEADFLDPAPGSSSSYRSSTILRYEEAISMISWGGSGTSGTSGPSGGSSSSNDPVSVVEDLLEIYRQSGSGSSAARRRRHEFRPATGRSRRQLGPSLRPDDPDNDKDSKGLDSNDGVDKKPSPAYLISLAVCKCPVLQPFMYELLTTRNAEGFTPFMMAISLKAYPIGLLIWDAMKAALAHENKEMTFENLRPMVCPTGTKPDDSPLIMLCLNDMCSFTWTGAEHINQDIYECRTCGLVGSLCCCTECARICHKNHDCKLKQASPTAYCDCWEKCRCKALVGGNQKARKELFQKLIQFQEMLVMQNSRGENVIMFLVQTVARQLNEHKQGPHRNRSILGTKRRAAVDPDQPADMPDHDLDPPKFCRRVLEYLMLNYQAVRTLLMSGVQQFSYNPSNLMAPARFAVFNRDEEEMYLNGQDGCSQLDRFTHCMLLKCFNESEDYNYNGTTDLIMLSNILETLTSAMKDKNTERAAEAQYLARRFVRSVVRQYVVSVVSLSPTFFRKKFSHNGHTSPGFVLSRCKKVFQSLIGISLVELCDAADSLIAPVRLGIVKPTAPFMQLSAAHELSQASDEVFGGDSMYPSGNDDHRPDNDSGRRHRRWGGDGGYVSGSQPSQLSRRGDRSFFPGGSDRANTSASRDWDLILGDSQRLVRRGRDRGGEEAKDRIRSPRSSTRTSTAAPGGGDDDGDDDDDDEDNEDENDDDLFRGGESSGPSRDGRDSNRNELGDDAAGGDEDDGNDEDVEMRDVSEPGLSSDLIEYVIKDYSDSDDEGASGRDRRRSGDNNDGDSRNRRDDQAAEDGDGANDGNGEDDDDEESNDSSVVEETEEEEEDDHTVYESDRAASPVDSGAVRSGAAPTSASQNQPSVPVPGGVLSDAAYSRSRANALANVAPHLAWALGRPQERARTGGAGGLIYIDSVSLRRNAAGTTNTANAAGSSSDNARVAFAHQEPWNMSSSAQGLARAFGVIVRQVSELLAKAGSPSSTSKGLKMSSEEVKRAERYVERRLKRTWDWLLEVMDATEAEVRFGAALSQASGKTTSSHIDTHRRHHGATAREREAPGGSRPGLPPGVTSHRIRDILGRGSARRMRVGGSVESTSSSRRDFLSYMVSLMRGNTGEHLDSLPHVDIASLKHVAYIFDALMFYMRSSSDNLLDTAVEFPSPKIGSLIVETSPALDDSEDPWKEEKAPEKPLQVAGPSHSFFRRSESTLYLGGHPPDPFSTPLIRALPLADQPHLLNSNSRREELFGILPHPAPTGEDGPSWYHTPKHLGFSGRGSRKMDDDDDDDDSDVGRARLSFPDSLRSDASRLYDDEGDEDTSLTHQILMGRWRLTLELFGRVFVDDVGQEPGSLMSELGGFQVREGRFRREMEKLRSGSTRDINLARVERNRGMLIQHFFRELNSFYSSNSKKTNGGSGLASVAISRVKVTFRDEPGEGSGVARSFYSAVAEALLAPESLPNLESCQVEAKNFSGLPYSLPKLSGRFTRDARGVVRSRRETRRPLNADARPFYMPVEGRPNDYLSRHNQSFGERLLPRVQNLRPSLASKITGMMLELPPTEILGLMSSDDLLRQRVEEAVELLQPLRDQSDGSNDALDMDFFGLQPRASSTRGEGGSSGPAGSGPASGNSASSAGGVEGETPSGEPSETDPDNTALFFCPGKKGFYSPRYGRWSPERINAFRNVGRLIGLCLLQNELCPLYMNRHVFKYILGRQIRWHDLAFYDPEMYESFRQLITDVRSAEGKDAEAVMETYDLVFSVNVRPEEGGKEHELIPDGGNVAVTPKNVYDYVRRYALFRMVGSHEKALEAMKKGVYDVIPQSALDGLTSEDFRLLLNGVGEVQVSSLVSFTTFHDESGEGGEKLARYRRWFWSVVEKMANDERQDLVYFWTGSPALPASEEGFQPMPSITIRPADDNHLPTANTCISRLYLPLYSSKSILRSKLLLAVKAKNFGFV